MHRSLLVLALVVLAVACGGDARVPVRTAPVVSTPAVVAPSAPTPPVRRARSNPARDTLVRLRRAISEGRRLSHAGSHELALAEFEKALALDPISPRLRCEAGYVAYLAGHSQVARDYVTAALRAFQASSAVPEAQRVPVAMCLFNAGLVFEANERPAEAIEALRRSLALRENATVRARLQALTAGRGEAATPREAGAARDRAYADACGLSESMEAADCRMRRSDDEHSEGTLVSITETTPTGAAPVGFEARIATAVATIGFGMSSVAYLEVSYAGATRVGYLDRAWVPGIGGVSGELAIGRFEWIDVVAGGRPELVVEVSAYDNDEDMGICYRSGGSTRTVVLCGTDDGTLRCVSLFAEATTYEQSYEGCEDEDVHPETRQRGHSLAYAFSQGTLQLSRQPDAREDVPATMPRARPVTEWLADPAFAWPRQPPSPQH